METDEGVSILADPNQASPVSAPSLIAAIPTSSRTITERQYDSDPPPRSHDPEPLPNVVYGSENWHNLMPRSWVPSITRDLARQRRTVSIFSFYVTRLILFDP